MSKLFMLLTPFKRSTAAVLSALLIQGCAIPSLTTRTSDISLPTHYQGDTDTQSASAQIDWSQWFDDPVLTALVTTALRNNQEAAAMLQRIQTAANEVYVRKGEYLPNLSFGLEADREKVGEFTRNGAVEQQLRIRDDEHFPDPFSQLRVGLRSSWEIDVWHKLRDAADVASMEYLASVEARRFFMTELVAEVSRTYFELLALDNHLVNLDRTLDIQRDALRTIVTMKQYGRTSSLPETRFRAEISKNESERFIVQQDITATENRLNVLLGRTPQPIPRDAQRLLRQEITIPATGAPAELLANRPDIRRAELELQAAELSIAVARANFYPSFALRADLGLEAFRARYLLDTPASLAYGISGDIFAPLLNRRAIEATYQNAGLRQVQLTYEYEQTVITGVTEVMTRLAELDNLAQSIERRQQQIASLDASIDIANQLFSSARGEYLEVLLAQREALEARDELIDAKQTQMSAWVNLYQALGGGWQLE